MESDSVAEEVAEGGPGDSEEGGAAEEETASCPWLYATSTTTTLRLSPSSTAKYQRLSAELGAGSEAARRAAGTGGLTAEPPIKAEER